jgi:hypothetical protein
LTVVVTDLYDLAAERSRSGHPEIRLAVAQHHRLMPTVRYSTGLQPAHQRRLAVAVEREDQSESAR